MDHSSTGPQVRLPFHYFERHREFINAERLNLEVYLDAAALDRTGPAELERFLSAFDHAPRLTLHGPFHDLAPGATDARMREHTLMRFRQAMDVASVLRPAAVVLHSGYDKWRFEHNPEKWLDQSIPVWEAVAEWAERIGTRVAVENIFEETPDNLAMLMARLGSERFGICFDTGHFLLFTRRTLDEWLDALLPHIIQTHLHDNHGDRDAHLPIGEGTFEFPSLLGRLNGSPVIHTVENNTPEESLRSIAWLRRYFG